MNPINETVAARLFSDLTAFVLTAIVVPLVIIGAMVVAAWARLRKLRKQDDQWLSR